MEKYTKAQMEVIEFEAEDVIAGSITDIPEPDYPSQDA